MPITVTSQDHPKWSPCIVRIISVRSNIVTVAVLDMFNVKKYDLDFWPLKVIQGQIWLPIKSPWVLHTSALQGPTSHLSPFPRYFESKFWRWPLTRGSSKVKFDGAMAQACSRHLSAILQNFSPIAQTVYEMCVTKVFHLLTLGANPGAKVHQKGRWPTTQGGLPSCQISPPCINPCWRYPWQQILRTNTGINKQIVNDISPACPSTCGDNNGH